MAKFIEADIIACMNLLENAKPGKMITYSEICREIRSKVYTPQVEYAVRVARKRLKEEKGMVFKPHQRVALRRLTDSEIVKTGIDGLIRVNRATQRHMETLKCVSDFEALSHTEQAKHNAAMAINAAIGKMTEVKSISSLETSILESGCFEMTFDDVAKFFLEA